MFELNNRPLFFVREKKTNHAISTYESIDGISERPVALFTERNLADNRSDENDELETIKLDGEFDIATFIKQCEKRGAKFGAFDPDRNGKSSHVFNMADLYQRITGR